MNWLYALVIGFALAISAPAVAHADGNVGCSNPCVVSDDATDGEFAETHDSGFYPPATYKVPALDDNQHQDMPRYNPDQGTYPLDDDSTADLLENEDISGS